MMDVSILIGLQASGKSTFYRTQLAKTHIHISKDNFRNNKKPARRQRHLMLESLTDGHSICIDNTNPTSAVRSELMELARQFDVTITGYYFSAKLEDCLARNAERFGKSRVPDVGLFATAKVMERPSLAEGFDTLWFVTLVKDGTFNIQPWIEDGSDGS